MYQKTFGALWDYAAQIENGEMSVQQAEENSLDDCKVFCKEQRDSGFRVTCKTLNNQKREYWRFGVPCGLTCKCYLVNIWGD
jgi:hypothetical protein